MKARFGKIGYPLFCDAGPYAGDVRIDLTIRLYLSPEEYARYEGTESLQITLTESGDGGLRTGSTAELSVGDVVTTGEAALAIGRRSGWEPVRGGLAEVRVHEHSTRPLPAPARHGPPPGESPIDSPGRSRTGHDCP